MQIIRQFRKNLGLTLEEMMKATGLRSYKHIEASGYNSDVLLEVLRKKTEWQNIDGYKEAIEYLEAKPKHSAKDTNIYNLILEVFGGHKAKVSKFAKYVGVNSATLHSYIKGVNNMTSHNTSKIVLSCYEHRDSEYYKKMVEDFKSIEFDLNGLDVEQRMQIIDLIVKLKRE